MVLGVLFLSEWLNCWNAFSIHFGSKFGQHARTAIGAGGLPHDIVVEINGEFEISDG